MDRTWEEIKSTIRDLNEWIRAREGWASKHEHCKLISAQEDWEHAYRVYARQLGYKTKKEILEEKNEKWYWDWFDSYTKKMGWTEKDFEYAIRDQCSRDRPNLYSSAIQSDIDHKWKNDPECSIKYY